MAPININSNTLSDLIDNYSDLLLRVAYSYMKNMPDAEDVVQDTFVKLMQKNPTFESEEHEKAWLIRVTINLCKNLLKTTWFKKTVPLDHTVEFTQQESIVIDAVLELSVKYRSVILLYYIIGYNIKEISDILGRKEATIASQLQRARAQLKSKLKEDFDYE